MVDSVGETESRVEPEIPWWKEIPEEARSVLKALGLEIDRGLPQNKEALERGKKGEWDWKETFIAVCRVVEKTEELGLRPGEQIWAKVALKERERGKGIERVRKEGAKLSGLTKTKVANEDVPINLPTLHFFGEVESLPVVVREFVPGFPVPHKLTEPGLISPVAEEWHHWRDLVCPVDDLSEEERRFLVVSEPFEEVVEVAKKNLADFERIVSSGESDLAREVQEIVGYSPEEIRNKILEYEDWYQAESGFRFDDNTPRNWVITEARTDEGQGSQGRMIDYGSVRFGSRGRSLHDAVYWLAHIWRPEQGEVRQATVAGFCRSEDDQRGICFNTLVRLPGTLARELSRGIEGQQRRKDPSCQLMRAKALGAMVRLAMGGFESFEVGIGPLHYPQES